jgi:hypothetical protein
MTTNSNDDGAVNRLHANKLAVEQAMQESVNEAILMHQRLGLPMVEWHDGQVVWVPADQLAVDDSRPTR